MPASRSAFTTRGHAFLASGVILTVAGMALGLRDLTRTGALLLAVAILARVVTSRRSLRLDVHRVVHPARVAVDERAVVTLSVRNVAASATPALLVEDAIPVYLGDRPRFQVSSIPAGRSREATYAVRSPVRGVHALGPLTVIVRDPFGLAVRAVLLDGPGSLVVQPRVETLPDGRFSASLTTSDGNVPHALALHGDEDVSVRPYRDDDDLRRVHWPATARTGHLMVRQDERPSQRQATIVLDTRASAHRGAGRSSTFEWAVSMAASVFGHLKSAGYAVHLVCADSVGASRSVECTEFGQALELLARVRLGDDAVWHDTVHRAANLTGRGGLVVACVAPMSDDLALRLATLRRHGGTGVAFVSHPVASPHDAAAAADTLRSRGWTVRTVSPMTPVPSAWVGHLRVEAGAR